MNIHFINCSHWIQNFRFMQCGQQTSNEYPYAEDNQRSIMFWSEEHFCTSQTLILKTPRPCEKWKRVFCNSKKISLDGKLFRRNASIAWCLDAKGWRLIGNPVRCTHQGANPGLYPQLYVVGRARQSHWDYPGKVSTKSPMTTSQKTCQAWRNAFLGRVSPSEVICLWIISLTEIGQITILQH